MLLDGGMRRELRFRGIDVMTSIWSANALIEAPQVVRQIHSDYIAAGTTVAGGCCETRPAHIAKIKELIEKS